MVYTPEDEIPGLRFTKAQDPSALRRLAAEQARRAELPAEPVRLLVVPVEELREPDQRFRCVPYSATITAATCLGRQGFAHGRQAEGKDREALDSRRRANIFASCGRCALGRQVATQLKTHKSVQPPSLEAKGAARTTTGDDEVTGVGENTTTGADDDADQQASA